MGRLLLLTVAVLSGAVACSEAGPCPMPLEVCDGACIDLNSDPRHCGGCGRACGAGWICAGGECGDSTAAGCATRGGGAFVTLEACEQTVKLWITNEVFVTQADALLHGATLEGRPVLALQAGTDCDAQWTWHVDAGTATFASSPPVGTCEGCPRVVERELSYYVNDVGLWCPAAASVVSVDRR